MASVCFERAAVERRAASGFQREFFSVNDIANFESDILPSKGSSIHSEGGFVPYEVVILTGGLNILSEGGIMPSEVAGQSSVFQEHGICFGGGVIHLLVRHDTFERAA